MKLVILHILIPILAFIPLGEGSPISKSPYTLIKNGEGMELSERWIKMRDGTKRREVRMTLKIHAPLDRVIHTLKDEKSGKEWNKNALDYRVKEMENQTWISYVKYSFPFPLSDRECYMSNTLVLEGDRTTIVFRSYDSRIFSDDEKIDKMMGLEGKWVAEHHDNVTTLSYHIISVPDASLPSWLVDPIIRKNLWQSTKKLREIIEKTHQHTRK